MHLSQPVARLVAHPPSDRSLGRRDGEQPAVPQRQAARLPEGRVTVRFKGRHWVALALAGFLAVALTVVWRQGAALQTARDLQALEQTRSTLEVQKSTAIGDISRARSRSVLVPLAEEKLGLRLPQDSEITILKDLRQD